MLGVSMCRAYFFGHATGGGKKSNYGIVPARVPGLFKLVQYPVGTSTTRYSDISINLQSQYDTVGVDLLTTAVLYVLSFHAGQTCKTTATFHRLRNNIDLKKALSEWSIIFEM
jgi:hypothetical protein